MLGGYNGKMLVVDLTSGKVEVEVVTEELAKNFLGGYGIGAKVLYNRMPPGADPLGPANILGFVPGPATGTEAFFSGRYTVVHKSPLTGGWNDANSGGYFGPELKKAGFDALFITGIAGNPVYLWIVDGKAELRNAAYLWGLDTKSTWKKLQEETGEPRVSVAAIGPPGERLALLSCIINDGHRAPGRGGTGAVMGSKKLKAIAVHGSGTVPVHDSERVRQINKKIANYLQENDIAPSFGTYGTGMGTAASALSGDSPVKNWGGAGGVDFGKEKAKNITATTLDRYKRKKYACASCPVGCGAEYQVPDGRWPLAQTERPEYETAAAFGSVLLNDQADVLLKCNEMCNTYGLDTIAAGMTIAWALECYEHGVLGKEDLDGLELTWGNGAAIEALLEKMAEGDGCGAVLANGSQYAARMWNKGEQYLQTASGIELPMHDPRFSPGLARTYQYDPTPGRHVKGGLGQLQMFGEMEDKYNYTGTGPLDLQLTAAMEILNCSGLCLFSSFAAPPGIVAELLEGITGMDFDAQTGISTGLRILNLRQAFNLREGIRPADLQLSQRAIGNPPLTAGPLKGVTVDNKRLAENFFAAAEWDWETGKPSLQSLRRLGQLEEVIHDLYGE